MKTTAFDQIAPFVLLLLLSALVVTEYNPIVKDKPAIPSPAAIQKTVGKKAMPLDKNTKPVSPDTIARQVAVDTVSHDTLKNQVQETSRKLDQKYFRKSLNLNRRSFVALIDKSFTTPNKKSNLINKQIG